jgi:hypothetical protein
MSEQYKGQDLLDIAAKAEQDLNSSQAKTGTTSGFGGKTVSGGSLSSTSSMLLPFVRSPLQYILTSSPADESGIDQSVTNKFPGSTAEYGSKVSGAGDNREIPVEEGGDIQKGTGRPTKAGDFDQGAPGEGPEDISRRAAEDRGGDNDVVSNTKN